MDRWDVVDRSKVLFFLLGAAVGASALAAVVLPVVTPQPDCPLEFGVSVLNTTYGWFYRVVGLKTEPRPIEEYNVTFFVYSPPDPYGNQQEIVHYAGPLANLVGASGNFSFEDRGTAPGRLDSGGDYFMAREWHNVRVERGNEVVGGTLACH